MSRPGTSSGSVLMYGNGSTSPVNTRPSTSQQQQQSFVSYAQPIVNDEIVRVVKAARFSTIPNLSEEDIADIWVKVCELIKETLIGEKGLQVPGLGTFAWTTRKEPLFLLAEKFVEKHNIRSRDQPPANEAVPVVPLNFAAIATKMIFDRATVESCVKELVGGIEKCISDRRGIMFNFHEIGLLSFKNGKVKFSFYPDFYDHYTLLFDLSEEQRRAILDSRPGTVGSFSRPSTRGSLTTPRRLRTPGLAKLGGSLGDLSPSLLPDIGDFSSTSPNPAASGSKTDMSPGGAGAGRPPAYKPIKWQSSLVSDGQVGIIDPSDQGAPNAPTDGRRAQRARSPEDPADLPIEDLALAATLRQRNIHSTIVLGTRGDDEIGLVDHNAKRMEWDYELGPIPQLPASLASTTTLRRENNTQPHIPNSHDPEYRKTSKEGNCGHTQGRTGHVCYVCYQRNQMQLDPSIKATLRDNEREEERQLRELQEKQERRAVKVEKLLQQAQRDATKRAADVNLLMASTRTRTPADEVTRADVFAFRPATSQSTIRHMNQDLALDQLAQHNTHSLIEHQREKSRRRAEEEHRRALDAALQEEKEAKIRAKLAQQEQMKTDLDKLVSFKKEVETHFEGVHPRQPVPFDVKHLPASNQKRRDMSSAHGRPAAALGPEMYREHDAREQRTKDDSKRVYDVQVELAAERNRKELQDKQDEKERMREKLDRSRQVYLDDRKEMERIQQERRQALEKDWLAADSLKKARDSEEKEYQKQPAPMTIMEQMDDFSRCNMCERDLSNIGKSLVADGKLMKTSHNLV